MGTEARWRLVVLTCLAGIGVLLVASTVLRPGLAASTASVPYGDIVSLGYGEPPTPTSEPTATSTMVEPTATVTSTTTPTATGTVAPPATPTPLPTGTPTAPPTATAPDPPPPLRATVETEIEEVHAYLDKAVQDGVEMRTWMYGPEPNTGVLVEAYAEAPGWSDQSVAGADAGGAASGGWRMVQYFDKSRMEVTDPYGDTDVLWFVTNGLLTVELVTGRLQLGDDTFAQHLPAEVNVAGDADDPTGPTYATFGLVLDADPVDVGTTLVQRIDRDGNVSEDGTLAPYGVTAAYSDEVTVHSIATPFWEFMNATGTIYENGQFVDGLLFPNPFYATGRPITEAYWASVKVGGTYRDVLMQCFERRCLTYTPGNPEGFATEAGNVGQHYYVWRYVQIPGEGVASLSS